jgi:hypothetical protein
MECRTSGAQSPRGDGYPGLTARANLCRPSGAGAMVSCKRRMRRWRGFVDEILRGAPFLRQGKQNDNQCGDDEAWATS